MEEGLCRGCRIERGVLAMRAYRFRLAPTLEQEQQLLRAAKMSAIWWNHLVRPMVDHEDRVRAEALVALQALEVERGAPPDPKTPEERKAAREARKLVTPEERTAIWAEARERHGPWFAHKPTGSLKEHLEAMRAKLDWWGLPVNFSNSVFRRVQQMKKPPRMKSVRRGDLGELTLPGLSNGGRPPRLVQSADGVQHWFLDVPNSKPKKSTRPEDIAVLGAVEVIVHRPLPAPEGYCSTSIAKHPDGWYASLVYEVPPEATRGPRTEETRHLVVGVDRGSADELATWSRELGPPPRKRPGLDHAWTRGGIGALPATPGEARARACASAYDRRVSRRLAREGLEPVRALTAHKWGRRAKGEDPGRPASKRWRALHARNADAQTEGTRLRKEVRRMAAQYLARQARVVVLEDLRTKQMTAAKQDAGAGGRGLNRSILRQGWYELELHIRAAADKTASVVVAVPPAYTSSTCAHCGAAVERPQRDTVVCPAHGELPADRNAARNIEQRGAALLGSTDLAPPDIQRARERLSAEERAALARAAPAHAQAWAQAYLARHSPTAATKKTQRSKRTPKTP
jgi:transposase